MQGERVDLAPQYRTGDGAENRAHGILSGLRPRPEIKVLRPLSSPGVLTETCGTGCVSVPSHQSARVSAVICMRPCAPDMQARSFKRMTATSLSSPAPSVCVVTGPMGTIARDGVCPTASMSSEEFCARGGKLKLVVGVNPVSTPWLAPRAYPW